MSLKAAITRLLKWYPGFESASSFKPDHKVNLRSVLFSNNHILALGLLLILLSNIGSAEIANEILTIPPGEYVAYSIDIFPGQKIRVDAGVYTGNISDNDRRVLEVLIMDDEDFDHFESEEYNKIDHRYALRIGENFGETVEVNSNWFGEAHVVLNNKIRVNNRDTQKETHVTVTLLNPLGYLGLPGFLIAVFSGYKIIKEKIATKNNLR
ncbi:hypothetical protein GF319_15015 [Candidatus Bathyarchaeota archaeon]|nr:hypothetical protein [Candidatus Bathyarchaeota archaeon]